MKLLKTLLATAIVASSVPALAYEAGDMLVKAGVIKVTPKDGNADTSALAADSELDLDADTQLGITFTYMATDKIGVEVLGATPFQHTAELDGGAADGSEVVTTKHLPPTVSAQYYFLDSASPFQLYAGLGLNLTIFFQQQDEAVDLDVTGLKKSIGLAYSVGADYMINDKWLVNAAVWKMDIDTEVEADSAADGLEVEVDPTVIMLGAGYKF